MGLRLFVVGATGHIGAHILDVGLSRGHQVTAFVRSPGKVRRANAGLSVIEGTLATPALAGALGGHDAVLSCIGPSVGQAFRPSTLMAESAASVVAAMATAKVKRLAIVSAAVLFPERRLGYRLFRWLLREHARDLIAMEAVVRASDFDWTIARPPRLVANADPSYRARPDALPDGAWSMSFRAVASFLVDSVEGGAHSRQIVGLAAGGAS